MASADVLMPSHSDNMFNAHGMAAPIERKRYEDESTEMMMALAGDVPAPITFDPQKHLNFVPPEKVFTMKELGFEDVGVSKNAVSQPFSLFTKEAIQQMRAEVLSKPVFDNCLYSSNLATSTLRGFANEHAPFVYDVWRSQEVLDIVSKIAGVELVPSMDFEIAHVNISVSSKEQQAEAQKAVEEHEQRQLDEGVAGCPWEDDKPIVDWHTDSYPFVCVTMLSDCTDMVGGETALRTGSGEIMKVRGPAMGSAVILQGRYIEHQALRALGGRERITCVTSFRPKSAFTKDDTVLTTVRAVSNLSDLYGQYAEYRLEMLEERVRAHLRFLRERKTARKSFDTQVTKSFLREQNAFLSVMLKELVDDDKVIKGHTDDSHLRSSDLKQSSQSRAHRMLS